MQIKKCVAEEICNNLCTSDIYKLGLYSVFQKSVNTLENLRDIKGALDGSAQNFDSPQICEDHIQELKQQVLMHVPASVSTENREKFQDLIAKTFKGESKEISVFVTVPIRGQSREWPVPL
jgi:hypothetical protein